MKKKGDRTTKWMLIACLLLALIYEVQQQQTELTLLENKYGKDSYQVLQHLKGY